MRLNEERKMFANSLGRKLTEEEQKCFDSAYATGFLQGVFYAESKWSDYHQEQMKLLRQKVDELELALGIC